MATRKTPSTTKKTAGLRPRSTATAQTAEYTHQTAKSLIRPEVGVQPRFKKRKPPAKYQYDTSLAPELPWDGQYPARERGEALIAEIETASKALARADADARPALLARIEAATRELKALSKPFLNWAGKAERLSFEVPTLPLFIHERLSTQAILDSVKGYKLSGQLGFDFHGQPDFVVKIKGQPTFLLLEIKGRSTVQTEAQSDAAARWCEAVSREGSFGSWTFLQLDERASIPEELNQALMQSGHTQNQGMLA